MTLEWTYSEDSFGYHWGAQAGKFYFSVVNGYLNIADEERECLVGDTMEFPSDREAREHGDKIYDEMFGEQKPPTSWSSSAMQPISTSHSIKLSVPIPITLTEVESRAMAGLSTEQKVMSVVRSCLVDKYGQSADLEEDRESAALSVSIDGVTVMIEAKRVTPKDDRYPLRGLPYRYDRPHDPVALEDWEILK